MEITTGQEKWARYLNELTADELPKGFAMVRSAVDSEEEYDEIVCKALELE